MNHIPFYSIIKRSFAKYIISPLEVKSKIEFSSFSNALKLVIFTPLILISFTRQLLSHTNNTFASEAN
ncbi:hypothetical protein [Chryseobacterium turcicum]|uniref:Uncharacterized protein n=1 Tax=Chryseobacterium turcicum TaxID=2898076 RepID=A0A9Q3YUV1_9FLAO|nr:hypothetical protein [Chryseobacterium turcicum]MCD1116339.1 hypothetical protein [Chryseobacterium turcicum]